MSRFFICGGLLLAVALVSLTPVVAQQTCLNYEPDVATLTGIIRTHTFPGPPNFESIAKGDARENIWSLHLTKSICMSAKGDAEAENNVTDLQLVFPQGQKQYDKYKSLKGRRVTVAGTLFHAETGHHHTKVLLTVTSIKKS